MGDVVQFPSRDPCEPENDLLTAVDVVIRDLRDIARNSQDPLVRRQAAEAGLLLGRAYQATLRESPNSA
jgi:hypothetical protein